MRKCARAAGLVSACLGIVLFVGACKSHDIESKQKIAKTSVPTTVMNGFQKDHPGAQINKVEEERYKDGNIHYVFQYWDNGKKKTVEYDKHGEEVEKE